MGVAFIWAAAANGTAVAGADYTAASGTLTFNPGQTSRTLPVSVLGDLMDEENETFLVTLSNPKNAALGIKSQGIGTIEDNDPPPVVNINSVTVTEGDTASQIMQFTVSLSVPSGKTVTVNYATANQTAVAGQDYMSRSGSLIFSPGQTSRTISITILGDLLPETTETFAVNLSQPVNATLGVSKGIGTILDNDAVTTLYLPVVIRP